MTAAAGWLRTERRPDGDTARREAAPMGEHYLPIDRETPDKRELLVMARRMDLDRRIVFFHCLKAWFWFDENSTDGEVPDVVADDLDIAVDCPGLAAELLSVGWIEATDNGLKQVGFNYHRPASHKELKHRQRAAKSRDKKAAIETLQELDPDVLNQQHAQRTSRAPSSARRRRPEKETGQSEREKEQNPGPDRTGPDPHGGLSFPLPPWRELGDFVDQSIAPEAPADDYWTANGRTGAFAPLKPTDLKKPRRLAEWHRRQLSLPSPVAGGSVAHLLLILATARRFADAPAGTVRKPIAAFVSSISRQDWEPSATLVGATAKAWRETIDAGNVTDTNWIRED